MQSSGIRTQKSNNSTTWLVQACTDKIMNIKSMIQSELRFKKIIQRSQKMDFLNNVQSKDKLSMKHSLFLNLFLLFNTAIYGIWKFNYKQYRTVKSISIYVLILGYLGLSFGIFWQDQSFLNKISTQQDAYKSEIKYLFRKQCLQNAAQLKRIQNRKTKFEKLNAEFQQFHTIETDSKVYNLLL